MIASKTFFRTIVIFATLACCGFATAQMSAPTPSKTGLKPVLPVVPGSTIRPLEDENNRFSAERRQPIAGFLDQVTQADAIIEVIVGRGRILTTKAPIAQEGGIALVAAGDPTVIDFEVAGPRLMRVLGRRVGISDLTITTDEGQTYSFDIHVVYDLVLVRAYMQQIFPDAFIKISQLREHVVLEGQARTAEQITQIEQTLSSFLVSVQTRSSVSGGGSARPGQPRTAEPPEEEPEAPVDEPGTAGEPPGAAPIAVPEGRPRTRGTFVAPRIINLMRVPGVQQVMLQVKVAELNRTALRRIGAEFDVRDNTAMGFVSTLLGNAVDATVTGVFPSGQLDFFLNALKQNRIVNVLAEPNLVAMHGQEAVFLAGGEFPILVPQSSGGGGDTVFTVEFKEFGVLLTFVPHILDDETIRLRVSPEVSAIDPTLSVVIQGASIPGLSTRRVSTTVELKQGQTLAMAGLLQVTLDANTSRIPGLGDIPYLGPFFSNTSHERTEKELIILVTPYLVSGMDACQVGPLPGDEIQDPNNLEFYLLNRIEGRTGRAFRSTMAWDNLELNLMKLEHRHACGPIGYSD